MIRDDILTVVEVLIVGPAILLISGAIWTVWGVAQAVSSAQQWWAEQHATVSV